MSFFSRFLSPKSSQDIIVVSGLPRSGTSMMMQILDAGGLPILTDKIRTADDDNPKGYYEFERVKALKDGDSAWLTEARGKVVKVISGLLQDLPKSYHYKIIFVQREISEVLASQKQMMARRGEQDGAADDTMYNLFSKHLGEIQEWLRRQPNMDVLYIQYAGLLRNPQENIQAVIEFLGRELNEAAMLAVPDKNLYRQRR